MVQPELIGAQAFKLKIAEREERQRRLQRGLGPVLESATHKDSTDTGGAGEGSHEVRMNELAAEKRKLRLKEVATRHDRIRSYTIG